MKKRCVIIALAIMVVMLCTGCSKEESGKTDYKSMTDEELKTIYVQVGQEIEARKQSDGAFVPFKNFGPARYIPNVVLKSGKKLKTEAEIEGSTAYTCNIKNMTDDDFSNYIASLVMAGYSDIIEQESHRFRAVNEAGYQITLTRYTKDDTVLKIDLKPIIER